MSTIPSIAIFPYLKTSESIQFKDLVFRNIEDISGVSTEVAKHLNNLGQTFFLRDNFLLKHISYAVIQRSSDDEQGDEKLLEQLREFQIILTYFYSAPHSIFGDLFLTKEHASLYLCIPKRIHRTLIDESHFTEKVGTEDYPEPDSRGEVEGYEVLLDFRSHIWITKSSRIYPPAAHIWLNYSQDLYGDIGHIPYDSHHTQLFSLIKSKSEKSQFSNRILTAIEWYNRSTNTDIEDDVALVHLAIAFESLLNLEQGPQVTARFREAVSLLLGGLPRLDSWLTQFYVARSQIVHRGHTANLMFVATDDPKRSPSDRTSEYRSLVSVGRQIFQLCLSTIINGALMTDRLKLSSMLFTNQQRLEAVCEILDKGQGTAIEKLQGVSQQIHDIENYKFVNETGLRLETLIGTAQLAVKTYLETNPTDNPDLLNLLKDFATTRREKDYYEALSKLREIQDYNKSHRDGDEETVQDLIFLLLDCAWHYTFMHYYWLKESKSKTK